MAGTLRRRAVQGRESAHAARAGSSKGVVEAAISAQSGSIAVFSRRNSTATPGQIAAA